VNHGFLMLSRGDDVPESCIWQLAMCRGQFVAIYTSRRVEQRSSPENPWRSTFARSVGEPPLSWFVLDEKHRRELENDLQSANPRYRHPTGEYGRYEPEYDEQFLKMCSACMGYGADATAVVPSTASDEEAMRLLGEIKVMWMHGWVCLEDRLAKNPWYQKRDRQKPQGKLSDLIKPIHLRNGWAYFLGFFSKPAGVVVFLCDDYSATEGLVRSIVGENLPTRKTDWLDYYGVIERW
jgi:hypothetical protein